MSNHTSELHSPDKKYNDGSDRKISLPSLKEKYIDDVFKCLIMTFSLLRKMDGKIMEK